MIDALLKDHIDPLWEKLARPLARAGMTPNQVTAAGLVLVCLVSAAYVWHRSELVFGLTLILAHAFDALDGAVARQTGLSSKTGGYFDAMVDRYQELIVLAAIGHVTDNWPLAMLAFAGAVITSYAKARTAIETPVSNTAWPDMFERLERIIFVCTLLILAGLLPVDWLMTAGLALYALLCHLTALQRIRRATALLRAADDQAGPS